MKIISYYIDRLNGIVIYYLIKIYSFLFKKANSWLGWIINIGVLILLINLLISLINHININAINNFYSNNFIITLMILLILIFFRQSFHYSLAIFLFPITWIMSKILCKNINNVLETQRFRLPFKRFNRVGLYQKLDSDIPSNILNNKDEFSKYILSEFIEGINKLILCGNYKFVVKTHKFILISLLRNYGVKNNDIKNVLKNKGRHRLNTKYGTITIEVKNKGKNYVTPKALLKNNRENFIRKKENFYRIYFDVDKDSWCYNDTLEYHNN